VLKQGPEHHSPFCLDDVRVENQGLYGGAFATIRLYEVPLLVRVASLPLRTIEDRVFEASMAVATTTLLEAARFSLSRYARNTEAISNAVHRLLDATRGGKPLHCASQPIQGLRCVALVASLWPLAKAIDAEGVEARASRSDVTQNASLAMQAIDGEGCEAHASRSDVTQHASLAMQAIDGEGCEAHSSRSDVTQHASLCDARAISPRVLLLPPLTIKATISSDNVRYL
jgi:hypothetical protein